MRHSMDKHIQREREVISTSLSLKLIPAPAYSGEETGRPGGETKFDDANHRFAVSLIAQFAARSARQIFAQAPWPSHGSRDSSRTQACIYKAEGEDLSPPLLLQLIPAPAYSPTNTLRSTIGDEVLNCQVRHGAGCVHLSMSTGNFFSTS